MNLVHFFVYFCLFFVFNDNNCNLAFVTLLILSILARLVLLFLPSAFIVNLYLLLDITSIEFFPFVLILSSVLFAL